MPSKFKVGRSPRSNMFAATSRKNPNRVVGGYKAAITRLLREKSEAEQRGLLKRVMRSLFRRS